MKRIVTVVVVVAALVVGGFAPSASAETVGDWQYSGEVGPAGTVSQPLGIARDVGGNIYVADAGNGRIVKFDPSGALVATFGSRGTGAGQLGADGPNGVAVDAIGNVFLIDVSNHRILKFSNSGLFLASFGSNDPGPGQLTSPEALAVDATGNVYVTDRNLKRVVKFSGGGSFIANFGSGGMADGQFSQPAGVAVDPGGVVYVADFTGYDVQSFSSTDGVNYSFRSKFGSYGQGAEQFIDPDGISIDSAGMIYVTDYALDRVQQYTSSGQFLRIIAGPDTPASGQVGTPTGVIADNGTAWAIDYDGNRIQKYRQFTTPAFTLAPDAIAPLGQPYSSAVGATAFPSPSYSLTGGALPTGLTLASTGGITGTPTAAGVFTATITATTPYASASTVVTITVPAGTVPGTVAPAASGTVAISGSPAIGHSVRAVPKGWAPGTTFVYQWTRSGKPIAGSTSATRHLTKSDLDKKIVVVVRSGALTATSKPVTAGHAFKKLGKPKVHGTAKVGTTLRLTKGTWSPKPHTTVRWYRDSAPIAKATKAHYVVKKADVGHRIHVKVTATRKHYAITTRTSGHTAKVKSR